MDEQELRSAFDDAFDHAVVFHGFTDYMRDYDVYVFASASPQSGMASEYLRYRFTHCVRAATTTTLRGDLWRRSMGDEFIDYDAWLAAGEPDGYVWGVKWHSLYPGMTLQPEDDETREWSARVGVPFRRALIETNAHTIDLVFADLRVDVVEPDSVPFEMTEETG